MGVRWGLEELEKEERKVEYGRLRREAGGGVCVAGRRVIGRPYAYSI